MSSVPADQDLAQSVTYQEDYPSSTGNYNNTANDELTYGT